MSRYLQFGEDGEQYHIASNTGWAEFGDWADHLDHDEYGALVQFWEHGSTDDSSGVADKLEGAIEKEKPAANVESTAGLLLSALRENTDAGIVLVTS